MEKNIDERVVLVKQRISSEVLQLLLIFLLASMLYKQFVLQAELSQYLIEFIGFFGALFYVLIRNYIAGTLTLGNINKRKLIRLSIIYALISGVIFTVISLANKTINEKYMLIIITYFVLSVVSFYIFNRVLSKWNRKRMEHIDKQLDDEEKN